PDRDASRGRSGLSVPNDAEHDGHDDAEHARAPEEAPPNKNPHFPLQSPEACRIDRLRSVTPTRVSRAGIFQASRSMRVTICHNLGRVKLLSANCRRKWSRWKLAGTFWGTPTSGEVHSL